jgi:hypothetical protein
MLQEIAKDRKETKQKLDDANRKYSQIVAAENSNKPEYSEPAQPRENTRVVMPEPAINPYAVEKQTAKKEYSEAEQRMRYINALQRKIDWLKNLSKNPVTPERIQEIQNELNLD